jgi:predicted nucleic-acid-binding protein
MLAIDTNVVIRYLVADHPVQAARARALLDDNDVFVGVTVLLESEWVLRSAYGFSAAQCATALTGFAGLPHVAVEDPAALAKALVWMAEGMDFADAIHLARAGNCEAFISFDQGLAKAAAKMDAIKVRAP